MSVEIACECDGIPAHSHVWRANTRNDRRPDPYDVRVWVDWKDLAREFATDRDRGAVNDG